MIIIIVIIIINNNSIIIKVAIFIDMLNNFTIINSSVHVCSSTRDTT